MVSGVYFLFCFVVVVMVVVVVVVVVIVAVACVATHLWLILAATCRELLVKCMKTIGQRLSSSPDMTFHNSCQHAFRYVMKFATALSRCTPSCNPLSAST